MPRQTFVAAGILRNELGQVLIAERSGDQAFAGLWEFPGGKLADGEESAAALKRELSEELGIDILEHILFMSLDHDYPDRSVRIDFYLIEAWRNEPEGRDGQSLRWLDPSELSEEMLLPADGPVVEALRQNEAQQILR